MLYNVRVSIALRHTMYIRQSSRAPFARIAFVGGDAGAVASHRADTNNVLHYIRLRK